MPAILHGYIDNESSDTSSFLYRNKGGENIWLNIPFTIESAVRSCLLRHSKDYKLAITIEVMGYDGKVTCTVNDSIFEHKSGDDNS